MKEVALITGITGFLGCHLGELLIEGNYTVIATRRTGSNLENCNGYEEQVNWINTDEAGWKDKVIAWQPRIIIHAAWMGVSAGEREDWEIQAVNLFFLQDLLDIASRSGVKKIIGLGSQAEYGYIDSVIKESQPLKPAGAYGALKIICAQLLKNYCIANNIQWYWLRIFSVFGEKEGAGWLLPNVIRTIGLKKGSKMDFSPGEQQYAYLYIKDFTAAVKKILDKQENKSGIYNISSTEPVALRIIITFIRDMMNPDFELAFGSLPYRQNQSMLIAGDMTLFTKTFGRLNKTPFEESINNIINYYTSISLNESI